MASTRLYWEFTCLIGIHLGLPLIVDLGLHLILQIKYTHEHVFVLCIILTWGDLRATGVVAVNILARPRTLLNGRCKTKL